MDYLDDNNVHVNNL